MIKHLPSFLYHEYGAAVEEGYFCPSCRSERLIVDVPHEHPEQDELKCPACGALYRSGWRRHVWGTELPAALKGTPVERLGGVFETIQAFAVPPRLAETVTEEPLSYLADFVIDIDREDVGEAQRAALAIWSYLDNLAPGQVRVYFSGSKGFHLIVPWQTVGAVPSPTLNHREYRQMATLVARATGVMPDLKIYSPSRMLRMPDSWHPKSGLYKVEVHPDEIEGAVMHAYGPRGRINTSEPAFSQAMNELFRQACEKAESMDKFKVTPVFNTETFQSAPPCVSTIMQHGLPYKGTRHAVYLMMARYWYSSGLPLELFGGYNSKNLTGGALMLAREFAQRPDPNSNTPVNVRMREIEDTVRYVYQNSMKFSCNSPKSIGICSAECALIQIERVPFAELMAASGIMSPITEPTPKPSSIDLLDCI